jgi:lipid A 4'-phosphatase
MKLFLINKLTIIFSSAIIILLQFYPNIDLYISQQFYNPTSGFVLKHHIIARILFSSVPVMISVIVASCIAILLINYFKHPRYADRIPNRHVLYILLTIAVGPGLVVNSILKESMGRARPSQIEAFKGSKDFSSAWRMSDQCESNCSFPSGHAAAAFYLTALAFIIPPRYSLYVYLFGMLYGSMLALVRIGQGGHFFSDTVSSLLIVLAINTFCAGKILKIARV